MYCNCRDSSKIDCRMPPFSKCATVKNKFGKRTKMRLLVIVVVIVVLVVVVAVV